MYYFLASVNIYKLFLKSIVHSSWGTGGVIPALLFPVSPEEETMRLLAILCTSLPLLVGPAYAASENPKEEISIGKMLYCPGDAVIDPVVLVRLDMNDDQAIAILENIWHISCQMFSKDTMWFVEDFAYGIHQGGKKSKLIFHEFRDDDKAPWYQWEYK